MANETKETVPFKEQMAAERKYYLGYTDTIPGTDVKISDARREHDGRQAEDNKAMERRRIDYLKREMPQEGVERTTVVTPGVLVNVEPKSQIEISEAEILAIDTELDPAAAAEAERKALLKASKADLLEQASAVRELPPDANVTKEKLADIILVEKGSIE
jgi:hypothetical protein